MTDSPIVQALMGRKSPDQLMWEFLTGGQAGNKVTVQPELQLGSPPMHIMDGPQAMELARAGLASMSKGQLFGVSR